MISNLPGATKYSTCAKCGSPLFESVTSKNMGICLNGCGRLKIGNYRFAPRSLTISEIADIEAEYADFRERVLSIPFATPIGKRAKGSMKPIFSIAGRQYVYASSSRFAEVTMRCLDEADSKGCFIAKVRSSSNRFPIGYAYAEFIPLDQDQVSQDAQGQDQGQEGQGAKNGINPNATAR